MKKSKNILVLLTGIAIGTALSGPAGHAAAGLLASPSMQRFYLQDRKIQLEAYVIDSNNYVRLRDVGAAVDFGVTYGARSNSVTIDPSSPYTPDTGKPAEVTNSAKETPQIPKVGDKIRCPDGSEYEIKDVSRYDGNMFADGPAKQLPAATCDWSGFDQVDPQPEVRRFDADGKDFLFARNTQEVKRIAYTLYNGMGNIPELWVNGQAKRRADGSPYIHLIVGAPEDLSANGFWPWRDSRVLDILKACPCGDLYLDAWDVYEDGVFLRTEYQLY